MVVRLEHRLGHRSIDRLFSPDVQIGKVEFIIEFGEYSKYARSMPPDLLRRRKSTAVRAAESTASD